jgi:nucleoside-diphosphate-sugar epimerase
VDYVIFSAGKAPARTYLDFIEGVELVQQFLCTCEEINFFAKSPTVIYLSSDAVYGDLSETVNEESSLNPTTWHSLMHIARESILGMQSRFALVTLRLCAIYGPTDTHSSYGPNRFINQAKSGNIQLFGNGEELRNHLYIKDLVRILEIFISKKTVGTFNIASQTLLSFHEIASEIASLSGASLQFSPPHHNSMKLKSINIEKMMALVGSEFVETPFVLGIRETYLAKYNESGKL